MKTSDGDGTRRGTSAFSFIIGPDPEERPAEPETVPRGPVLAPVVPHADQTASPTERLLDWVINYWPRPVIDVRSVYTYGPRPRNRKTAISLTERLAASYGAQFSLRAQDGGQGVHQLSP
jgi:hypothetical protein